MHTNPRPSRPSNGNGHAPQAQPESTTPAAATPVRPCLYCTAPATSSEHIIQEAIGGHYRRRILCGAHNSGFSAIDDALASHFEALTWASGLARDRGGRAGLAAGTMLRFVDARGREAIIGPNGIPENVQAHVEPREDGHGIARAEGPLRKLEAILAQQATGRGVLFQIIQNAPTLPINIGITDESLPGILKSALHFAATLKRPTSATIAVLLPYLQGERRIPVVPLPFRAPWFDPGRRLRHEITIYPDRVNTVATILLYSAIPVALELPGYVANGARRLVQYLDDGKYELVDVAARPVPRQRLSDREWDALLKTTIAVITQIFRARQIRDMTDIAAEAAMKAWPHDPTCGPVFQYRMRAALQELPFEPEQIHRLVREAVVLYTRFGYPFDLEPLTLR